jgi:hypothetical protein
LRELTQGPGAGVMPKRPPCCVPAIMKTRASAGCSMSPVPSGSVVRSGAPVCQYWVEVFTFDEQRIEAVVAEQRASPAGDRAAQRCAREREVVLRHEMVLMLRIGARGLAEFVIEENATDAGDVGVHAVENAAMRYGLVETLADEVAEVAAALRDAEGQRLADSWAGRIAGARVMAQEIDEVARGGEADAQHLRVLGAR